LSTAAGFAAILNDRLLQSDLDHRVKVIPPDGMRFAWKCA